MTWIFGGWLLCGVVLGAMHGLGLKKGTSLAGPYAALLGLFRLFSVGMGFVASAILGGIVPTSIGWALGFFFVIAIVMRSYLRPLHKEIAP